MRASPIGIPPSVEPADVTIGAISDPADAIDLMAPGTGFASVLMQLACASESETNYRYANSLAHTGSTRERPDYCAACVWHVLLARKHLTDSTLPS